jgi:hypothetical protein
MVLLWQTLTMDVHIVELADLPEGQIGVCYLDLFSIWPVRNLESSI